MQNYQKRFFIFLYKKNPVFFTSVSIMDILHTNFFLLVCSLHTLTNFYK